MIWLLLGGARSGKSALALRLAATSAASVRFVATGEALDEEMATRIAVHRAERPAAWSTIEAPVELEAALSAPDEGDTILLDCLTMWVANLIGSGTGDEEIARRAERVATIAAERRGRAIVVSNEVGWGIVPDNPLARRFRDVLGRVNATFACVAERSLVVVAGQVLELSSPDSLLLPFEPTAGRSLS